MSDISKLYAPATGSHCVDKGGLYSCVGHCILELTSILYLLRTGAAGVFTTSGSPLLSSDLRSILDTGRHGAGVWCSGGNSEFWKCLSNERLELSKC